VLFGEVAQGPGQDGGQARGGVVGVQCVQAELAQVGDEVVEQIGVVADLGGDQAEGQWEPVAQAEHLGDRPLRVGAVVGAGAGVVESGVQQGAGFSISEHVDVHGVGAVAGGQGGESVAAGD
jgi:hypothetical protein